MVAAQRRQDGVQDARDGRKAGQVGDQLIAQAQGRLADHRSTVDHHRDHSHPAVLVLDRVHGHDREGAHQIIEHLVLGCQVDREVVPFFGGDLGQAPFHHRLVGRDHLHHSRPAGGEVLTDRGHE